MRPHKKLLAVILTITLMISVSSCTSGDEGYTPVQEDYYIEYDQMAEEIVPLDDPYTPAGSGTECDPWQLSTPEHLEWINGSPERLHGYFLLMNDITASDNFMIAPTPDNRMTGVFFPGFAGDFDGSGNTITVNIYLPGHPFVGLFSAVESDGHVQNLVVAGEVVGGGYNGDIRVSGRIGGLAGRNMGRVINVHSAVNVSGHSNVGGLVGTNSGDIQNSHASGTVVGTSLSHSSIGGLAGYNGGVVESSYATGNVSVEARDRGTNIGGLIGTNQGSVRNSYATGDVDGSAGAAGGLAGTNAWGEIFNSYATGNVSGDGSVGGLSELSDVILSSAALNASITGRVSSTSRIWVRAGEPPVQDVGSNNHASAAILINGYHFEGIDEHDNRHGQTVSPEEIATETFWRETMGWDLDEIWEWNEALGLPILRDVPGAQNPVAPTHNDVWLGWNQALLGADFVRSRMSGDTLRDYTRIVENGRAYELFSTFEHSEGWPNGEEAWLFISEISGGEYRYLASFEITGRQSGISGGLSLADVNFDGINDVLIWLGNFGAQGTTRYTAFLNNDSGFIETSFDEIPSPMLDRENQRILGFTRNWAASHSYFLYEFVDGALVMIYSYTREFCVRSRRAKVCRNCERRCGSK